MHIDYGAIFMYCNSSTIFVINLFESFLTIR